MRRIITLIMALVLQGTAVAESLLDGQVAGLSFGDSFDDSLAALEPRCKSIRSVPVIPPSFPLAENTEGHLVCSRYKEGGVSIETVALTFADDILVMLYASGNAAPVLLDMANEPLQEYLHFTVSFREGLVADKAADRVWIMSPEATHPNLFQWPNPYVSDDARVDYASSATTPEVLQFGRRLEELQAGFEEQCTFMHLDTYRVWLLNQPEVQQQIDCFGYEFAGFPRKIEAVFGDGILEQAWILTGKGEENRVREALIAAFGPPIFVNEHWEVFDDNQVMLRKDKPEVLMLSKKLAPLFRGKEIDTR